MANSSENPADKDVNPGQCIELQTHKNISTLSVDSQLAGSTDSLLSGEAHRCPLPLRRHAIAFYAVIALLWAILSIPSIVFFAVRSNSVGHEDTTSSHNISFVGTFSSNDTQIIDCRKDFFLTAEEQCVPNCGSFSGQAPILTTFSKVVSIGASCFGIINSIVFLAVACIRWKNVFSFPSVFVVYLNTTLLFFISFFLTAYFDQEGLFCSSTNLIEAMNRSTSFCITMGAVLAYFPIQAAIWWLFHISFSWWKIRFPFHFREREMFHKYIHITCVLIGLILPAISVIITVVIGANEDDRDNAALRLTDLGNSSEQNVAMVFKRYGFAISSLPPHMCSPHRADLVIFVSTLPITILFLFGTPFLVMLFWLIYKHHEKRIQKEKSTRMQRIRTTRKLLVVFSYYIILGLMADLFTSLSAASSMQITEELNAYFQCESNGHDPANPCDRTQVERLFTPIVVLNIIVQFLIGLFPLVSLIYVLDTKDIKKQLASWFGVATWMPSISIENSTQQARKRDYPS